MRSKGFVRVAASDMERFAKRWRILEAARRETDGVLVRGWPTTRFPVPAAPKLDAAWVLNHAV
jgi:hypothetical protein